MSIIQPENFEIAQHFLVLHRFNFCIRFTSDTKTLSPFLDLPSPLVSPWITFTSSLPTTIGNQVCTPVVKQSAERRREGEGASVG